MPFVHDTISGPDPSHEGAGRKAIGTPGGFRLRLPDGGSSMILREPAGLSAEERARLEQAIPPRLEAVAEVSRQQHRPLRDDPLAPDGVTITTLAEMIGPARPRVSLVLDLALQLTGIIAELHHVGVLHRELNPANILWESGGTLPIAMERGAGSSGSNPGVVLQGGVDAAHAYLAPEQTGRTGRPVDQRTDLYGLGAIFYLMGTGKAPFSGHDPLLLTHEILTLTPEAPIELNPEIPLLFSDLTMRLLEKEPDRRYQSAEGVVHDLARLREMEAKVEFVPFCLGMRDFPPRLAPPSRLIGREAEIGTLRNALEQARNGHPRSLLVTGPPGVGKSTLIDELRAMAGASRGWFVAGKFDQYRHEVAMSAFVQALRVLGSHLLAEPEAELAARRERIRLALGPNAGVISALLPEFRLLLGSEPEIMCGDPVEARSRLHQAGLDLLRAVASRQRPLVLVVDDLQWANQNSIDFMDAVLTGDGLQGLLLVGSYRDTEVNAAHPLSAKLPKWEQLNCAPLLLRLNNLRRNELGALIGEMLGLEQAKAAELAHEVGQRTDGNPYDTIELLNSLRRDGALYLERQGWNWDAGTIRRCVGERDVLELLAGRIAALPRETHDLLKLVSCIGGRMDHPLLAAASGLGAAELEARLAPALEDGLLVAEREGGAAPASGAALRFRHDRVQQSLCDELAPGQRCRLHLEMARRLAPFPEYSLQAAEHYLPALPLIPSREELLRAVGLFREAAAHACLSAAHSTVERFLAAAMGIRDSFGMEADHPEFDGLETGWHRALYSLGRFAEADEVYLSIVRQSREPLELTEAACIQMNSLTNRGRHREAVNLGLDLLRLLGLSAPENMGEVTERGLDTLYRWVAEHSPSQELQRRELDDPRLIAAAKILHRMMGPAFFCEPSTSAWLVLQSHRLWVEHGPCGPLMACFGGAPFVTIALRQDYRTGACAARFSLPVGEAHGYEPETSWVRHCYAIFAVHWIEPLESSVRQARLAREGLLRGGDLQFACFTYHTSLAALLDCAPTLDEFAVELESALSFALRTGNVFSTQTYLAYRQLLRSLRGETEFPGGFNDPGFDEQAHLAGLGANPMAIVTYHLLRGLSALFFGDMPSLALHANAAMPLVPFIQGFYPTLLAYLLKALALADLAREAATDGHRSLIAELDDCRQWIASRATDAEENFLHLLKLVEAERAWALGDPWGAAAAFDAALCAADARQRPWHRALIAERSGCFHLSHGLEHAGRGLISEARHCYREWGAGAKAGELERSHPFLRDSAAAGADHGQSVAGRFPSDAIDLLAILRASQALSSETGLDRLRSRVTLLLGTLTGATGVTLVLWHDDLQGWFLASAPDSPPLPVEAAGAGERLPLSAFRYAERTRNPLLVEDATRDARFNQDPYLAGLERCSLLAVPILSQGTPRAVLLLENRLSRGAFSAERLDAVKLIAGQLAVSLDNALLYDSLERRVAERTAELEEEVGCRRLAEELYRTLVEQSPDGILITDPETGRIVQFNGAAHRQLGYSREEFGRLGLSQLEADNPGAETAVGIQSILAEGGRRFEAIHRTRTGEPRNILAKVQPIRLSGRTMLHCIFRDITDRKRMEREMLRMQKLESLSILAGGIAHDFNNLLTGILGNISMAKLLTSGEDRVQTLLAHAEKASQRAGSLTKQLLTFAKGGEPVRRVVAIGETIRESASFAVRGSNVRCEFRIPSDLWPCKVDEGQLGQVINNLIINADQAMPAGGLISVSCSNEVLGEGGTLPLAPGHYIRIVVSDQGEGIPDNLLADIFDPYFTTKERGTGLGLATTYSVIKRHGGVITVESKPGAGTAFTIRLPAAETVLPDNRRDEHRQPEGGKRILVMDDEELVLDIARSMLSSLGYEVECVKDGTGAVVAYRSAMESGKRFHAVIMDLTVPGGMGGKETLRGLLEIDPTTRAIVSSGYSDDPVMAQYAKYGFAGILVKPYRIEELCRTLNESAAA